MTPDERAELLAGYVLGALSRPERDAVERLVRSDASAAADLAALHRVVDLVALDVPLQRADPALRARVLEAARSASRPRRIRVAPWRLAAVAAALVAVVFGGMWGMRFQDQLTDIQQQNAALSAVVQAEAKRLDALGAKGEEAEATALQLELAASQEEQQLLVAVTLDPEVWSGVFAETEASHGATGRFLWSAALGAGVVVAQGLPALPLDAVYQIWVDDGLQLRPAGIFVPNERGDATVLAETDTPIQPLRISVAVSPVEGIATMGQPVVLSGVVERD